MNKTKTAILIFANSSNKELQRKPINSLEVFETLNTETLKTVKKTGLPYFHFSENQQIGNNFGERFKNAIDNVFNKGFDTVISVGNDTPHLSKAHINIAKDKLTQNDFVLGPSIDGGYYLMGFTKSHFNKLAFLELQWEKQTLQGSFQIQINNNDASVFHLEMLSDLDDLSDIELILQHFKKPSKHTKSILLKINDTPKNSFGRILSYFKLIHFTLFFNKGSPFITSHLKLS